MFARVRSETPESEIELNIVMLIRAAKAFGVPLILSAVGVGSGANGPTRQSIQAELPDAKALDRSSMNAWLDKTFHAAFKATGKKRLIFCALPRSTWRFRSLGICRKLRGSAPSVVEALRAWMVASGPRRFIHRPGR